MHSIIAAGFVCACNERVTTLEDEEKKGTKKERCNRAATMTEASFQTTGKERNRSGALAKKNEVIALKKPGLKRSGNNLFGERRGMRRRWRRRIFRKRLTERQLFPRWSDSGADSVELVRGGEGKAASRECNSDRERDREREREKKGEGERGCIALKEKGEKAKKQERKEREE